MPKNKKKRSSRAFKFWKKKHECSNVNANKVLSIIPFYGQYVELASKPCAFSGSLVHTVTSFTVCCLCLEGIRHLIIVFSGSPLLEGDLLEETKLYFESIIYTAWCCQIWFDCGVDYILVVLVEAIFKGDLLCKIHFFMSFIYKHVSPLCKETLKFQEKRFSLFLSWSIYIKTCLKMSWSDFGHFMMS